MSAHEPRRLALVTAVYPGVEPFLADWYRSVRAQDDPTFDLWIASDALAPEAAREAAGAEIEASWVPAAPGDTPAQVRQRVLERVAERYDAVVLVDADDVLHPERVGAARRRLATADLSACALRFVDERGRDLGATLPLPAGLDPDATLPRTNVFGLSNTAYRCELLRRCLPVPRAARAVDWFLATRAWLGRARLDLDPVARMDYRQHGANMTTVRPPFGAEHVRRDTPLVAAHLELVAATAGDGDAARLERLRAFGRDVDAFARRVVAHPERLAAYLERLNGLDVLDDAPAWWAHVAHPALRDAWSVDG